MCVEVVVTLEIFASNLIHIKILGSMLLQYYRFSFLVCLGRILDILKKIISAHQKNFNKHMTHGSNSSESASFAYLLRLETRKYKSFTKIFTYWIRFWFTSKISQKEKKIELESSFAEIRTWLCVEVSVKVKPEYRIQK